MSEAKFVKYNSIENSYNTKFVNKIIEHGYDKELWVVTNKVHGANFAFYITENDIVCASKNEILTEESNFYNFQYVRDRYIHRLRNVFHMVREGYDPNVSEVSVHGEIFGGSYPHPDVVKLPHASRIQKGIHYTPDNDFYMFDVKIDGVLIDYIALQYLSGVLGCPSADHLATGTLQECLEYPNDFQDPTYKYYGLPAIEDNITEGTVIKPVKPLYIGDHRVILKNKNEKWSEKSRVKKTPKAENLSEEVIHQLEILSQYITEQRLDNVLSHIGGVEDKDFGRLIGEFTKDVLDDYIKESDRFDKLEVSDQKIIKNKCARMCSGFLRPKFRQIVY